jgi:hypothetical protein
MKPHLDAEIVVPREMTPEARQVLIDDLYDVHCRIFDGVDRKSFVKYVVESKAEHTSIVLHKSDRGQTVGYFAMHIFERELRGKTIAILRGEAGTLREHRGGNVNARFALENVLRYALAHPRRPMYYLGSLVHPSSYAQIARFADCVYPNAAVNPPSDVASLMADLAATFGLEPVDENNPLVCKVGWKTIDSAADRDRWLRSENTDVQFFLAANPGYVEGHGLLTVAPLSLAGLLRATARYAGSKAKRWGRNLAASLAPRPAGPSFARA